MICISDHAKTLVIYYKVTWRKRNDYNCKEVEELYYGLQDAIERAEELAEECFVDIDEIRLIQDDKRVYTTSYYLEHF